MPFCKSCGSPVEGQFCPKCGTSQAAPAAQGYNPPPPPPAQPYAQAGAVPVQPVAAAGGMSENVAGLLCYILGLITGVLFLVLDPYNKNPFVRFHAFQSIFFNVAAFALMIVFSIVSSIVFAVLPFSLWALWGLLGTVLWLAILVLAIFVMVKAYQGVRYKLPVVGDLAEKQAGH